MVVGYQAIFRRSSVIPGPILDVPQVPIAGLEAFVISPDTTIEYRQLVVDRLPGRVLCCIVNGERKSVAIGHKATDICCIRLSEFAHGNIGIVPTIDQACGIVSRLLGTTFKISTSLLEFSYYMCKCNGILVGSGDGGAAQPILDRIRFECSLQVPFNEIGLRGGETIIETNIVGKFGKLLIINSLVIPILVFL